MKKNSQITKKKRLPASRRGASPAPLVPFRTFPAVKYFDYDLYASSTTTVGFNNMTPIPQGVGQSNRTVDTAYIVAMDVLVIFDVSTTDITNEIRWSIFNWLPNTAGVTPGVTSIYENTNLYGPSSPFNFEGRHEYNILMDRLEILTGTNTNPTNTSKRVFRRRMTTPTRIDFNTGVTTGLNHIYWTNVSDSAVVPFPTYHLHVRFWFKDAI